jgi:hypothetical protein
MFNQILIKESRDGEDKPLLHVQVIILINSRPHTQHGEWTYTIAIASVDGFYPID